jgi:hypothetical protein
MHLIRVGVAVAETFARRQNHPWPPTVSTEHFVIGEYEVLAAAHPDAPLTTAAAVSYLNDVIKRINNA